MRGRPVLDRPRSGSPSEMDEEEDDKDEVCERSLSLGSGIAGTGSAPCTALESADMTIPQLRRCCLNKEHSKPGGFQGISNLLWEGERENDLVSVRKRKTTVARG